MKNVYYVLRHGHSLANEKDIILSHPEDGQLDEFGLSPKGEAEVRLAVEQARSRDLIPKDLVIISSPFSRTRMSAEIVREVIGISDDIIIDERLRERYFGEFERKSSTYYLNVWEKDKLWPEHKTWGVESTLEVLERTVDLIHSLECIFTHEHILLVAHGDALQILLTWFTNLPHHSHREVEHLQTAEIRRCNVR